MSLQLQATRIDQSFSLEDGSSSDFLVLLLPDGTELRAPIEPELIPRIVHMMNGSAPRLAVATPEADAPRTHAPPLPGLVPPNAPM